MGMQVSNSSKLRTCSGTGGANSSGHGGHADPCLLELLIQTNIWLTTMEGCRGGLGFNIGAIERVKEPLNIKSIRQETGFL